MSSSRPANIPASVRQRLLNIAKERGEAFNLILTRYALERLLYRMSISEFRDSFLLKGAMLHSLWYDKPFRATKDLDLLGYGSAEIDAMVNTFRAICGVPAVADGVEFEPTSVRGIDIRVEDEYQGVRIVMNSTLAGAKIPLQIDIGFGDVVIPNPETVTYPNPPRFSASHPESLFPILRCGGKVPGHGEIGPGKQQNERLFRCLGDVSGNGVRRGRSEQSLESHIRAENHRDSP